MEGAGADGGGERSGDALAGTAAVPDEAATGTPNGQQAM